MWLQAWLWRQGYWSKNTDENWGDHQKKKGQRLLRCKISSLLGLKMTHIVEVTADDFFFFFFFFLEITPIFVLGIRTASTMKPATASHCPAFYKKNVGGAINFVSWKFVIQCPDFCFTKYGNPTIGTRSWIGLRSPERLPDTALAPSVHVLMQFPQSK